MSNQERGTDFEGYWQMDVTTTSGVADLATVDVNGTELILKRHEHVPVLVEIYVENEAEPIGTVNVARGCTVALGGVGEGIAQDLTEAADDLQERADTLDRLAHRSNPAGTPKPEAED